VVGKERFSQIIVNLLVAIVPRCIGSNAETLGLKHLQFPDMCPSGESPDGARVVHHRTDEPAGTAEILMDRPLLLFRRGPNTPSLFATFFLI